MILKRKAKQTKTRRQLGWVYPFLVVAIAVFVLGLAFSPRPEFQYTARIELRSETTVENASQAADRWIDVDTVVQAAKATRIVDAGELKPETMESLRQAVRVRVTDDNNDNSQLVQVQFQHHNHQVATDFLNHLGMIAVANATPGLNGDFETQETSSDTVEGVFGESDDQPNADLAIKRGAFIASRTGSVSKNWLSNVALTALIAGALTTVLLRFQSKNAPLMNAKNVAEVAGVPVIGSVFPSRTKPKERSASLSDFARRLVFSGEMVLSLFLVFVAYNMVVDSSFVSNFIGEPFSTVAAACDQHLRGIPVSGVLE